MSHAEGLSEIDIDAIDDVARINKLIADAGKELGRLKKEKASKEDVSSALETLQKLKNRKGALDPTYDPTGSKAKTAKRQASKKKGKHADKAQMEKAKAREAARKEIATSSGRTFQIDKMSNFALWYESICGDIGARLVDKSYPVKGMPVFTPNGFFMHNRIMGIIEQEWEKQGIDKAQFPLLIPESFLVKEEDHVRGFADEVFWVTKEGKNTMHEPMALRPTSETAMYSMFSKWIQSFRDLPVKVHQTCQVFRYETKDTRPLIRAREIHWNEAHTAHATREEALENLEDAWKSYLYLINDICGVYGLRIRRPEWDKFAGAEHTDVLDVMLPDGKVLQVVGAHYLGQKFANVFDVKFLNKKNEFEHAFMTCYGISTRILASLVAIHGDNNGLRVPSAVAKVQVVIVPIKARKSAEEVVGKAHEIRSALVEAGLRAFVDDGDKKPGQKYFYWEMMGACVRLEIGSRDLEKGCVTIVRRDQVPSSADGGKPPKKEVPEADLLDVLRSELRAHDDALKQASREQADAFVTECSSVEEVKAIMDARRGFAKIPYYSVGVDGEEGDELLKEATGAEVRGFLVDDAVPPKDAVCAVTGKPATVYAYCAKSY